MVDKQPDFKNAVNDVGGYVTDMADYYVNSDKGNWDLAGKIVGFIPVVGTPLSIALAGAENEVGSTQAVQKSLDERPDLRAFAARQWNLLFPEDYLIPEAVTAEHMVQINHAFNPHDDKATNAFADGVKDAGVDAGIGLAVGAVAGPIAGIGAPIAFRMLSGEPSRTNMHSVNDMLYAYKKQGGVIDPTIAKMVLALRCGEGVQEELESELSASLGEDITLEKALAVYMEQKVQMGAQRDSRAPMNEITAMFKNPHVNDTIGAELGMPPSDDYGLDIVRVRPAVNINSLCFALPSGLMSEPCNQAQYAVANTADVSAPLAPPRTPRGAVRNESDHPLAI